MWNCCLRTFPYIRSVAPTYDRCRKCLWYMLHHKLDLNSDPRSLEQEKHRQRDGHQNDGLFSSGLAYCWAKRQHLKFLLLFLHVIMLVQMQMQTNLAQGKWRYKVEVHLPFPLKIINKLTCSKYVHHKYARWHEVQDIFTWFGFAWEKDCYTHI